MGPKPTKTMATMIRRHLLTESSLIVHWCSDEFGIVKSVAKGARRSKSPFSGKLDLFYRCEIELVPARQGDLHILKDVAVRDSRLGLRKTYRRTLAASYFIRLLETVAEIESPIADLADLLERGLNYLEQNEPDLRAVRHFEKQLATMLGIVEDGVEPIESISDTFGKLPNQRDELLRMIE